MRELLYRCLVPTVRRFNRGVRAMVTLTMSAQIIPALTFAPIPTQVVGAAPFAVNATSASSGAVTYAVLAGPAMIAGSLVTVTGSGTVVLWANQAASGGYAAAVATTSFTIGNAASSVNQGVDLNAAYRANDQLTLRTFHIGGLGAAVASKQASRPVQRLWLAVG